MAENRGGKVRPRRFLERGHENLYERLGVSPFASPREIQAVISIKRSELQSISRRKGKSGFGAEEEDIQKLDKMRAEIKDAQRKQQYDEQHPENILLTVQTSQTFGLRQTHRKAGLISEALADAFGLDLLVPSPHSAVLWRLGDIDEETVSLLARYAAPGAATDEASRATLLDLDQLIERNGNG